MIEVVKINWVLMAAHACWILGGAMIAAVLSIMEFNRSSRKPIKLLWVSAGLIVLGVLLINFKIPTSKLLVSRVSNLNEAGLVSCEDSIAFPVKELQLDGLNGRHKRNTRDIIDNTLALFYDGFIRTPLVKFKPGDYMVEFKARGTRALDEYAAVKVEFECLEGHYLIVKQTKFIVLNPVMKKREMRFRVEESSVGRIKISFVNDDLVPGKEDRNAWIKNISISSE